MRRATLIVNPAAGNVKLLAAQLPAILALLAQHGYEAAALETTADGDSATVLATEAAKLSTLVLACGGDGTVHGVVQGLAHTGVALGIVPVGTANALARNLKLSLDPLTAVTQLMSYKARAVPLGQITTASTTRWFCLMAGCGPAGALVHAMADGSMLKQRFGRAAYYLHAARIFLTRRSPAFKVEYRNAIGDWHSTDAIAMMACWVPDLGGLFSGVTHKASVMDERLHVQVVRGPAWLSLPCWMLFGARGPWVRDVEADGLRCSPLSSHKVYVQADAEPMGALPCKLRVVEEALLMLMPVK